MKLLYILNVANRVNNFSYTSMVAAQELGWEFQIAGNWGYKSDEERLEDEKKYGIKIHQVNFLRNPLDVKNVAAYKKIKEIIKREKIDIIHCNTPIGGVCGRLAGKKCGVIRIIYQAHGFHFYKGAPLLNWLLYYPVERLLAHDTDALITINQEDYELALKFKLRNNGKVYYVPGVGIDLKAYEQVSPDSIRKTVRKELGLNENAIVCISMGDLIPRKNYGVAISAIGQLCKIHPEIHYLICGRGSELEKLKEQAVKCGAENNVHFLGFREDIKALLQGSDFFLFTSLQEGLPRSTMEAMASGLPLVCSRIRGNTDLIDEGQGGFMFEPTDVAYCVRAISSLLATDYERMGRYNLDRIREFSLEKAEGEIKTVYQNEFAKMSGGGVLTDLSEYYPAWYKKRLELGLRASDTVLIAVGRLDRNKNNKIILRAVEMLKDSSVHLVLCGDGEEKSVLEELAQELSIEKQIHFLGNRSDMKELYATSDIFVMASYREGLSRSVMEAMASGLPCVVSDIRGNRDLIEDRNGGYLISSDEYNLFSDRIKFITENIGSMKAIGRNNLSKIKQFRIEFVAAKINQIYGELLEK